MIPKTLTAEQRLEKAVLAIMHRPEYVALAGVMMIGKAVWVLSTTTVSAMAMPST